VERLADSDRLTGLLNQTAFRQVTDKLHAYCQRQGLEQSLIMLDIDHFKQVNDKADHMFGSWVIQEIGRMLADACRQSDVLARFGGDEFIIFLPSTDAGNAARLCDRIRSRINAEVFRRGRYQTQVTLSFGIATTRHDSLNTMMEQADAALYQSKASGRD
jgi:diguanylate cyclase (GGDEF)-like protein